MPRQRTIKQQKAHVKKWIGLVDKIKTMQGQTSWWSGDASELAQAKKGCSQAQAKLRVMEAEKEYEEAQKYLQSFNDDDGGGIISFICCFLSCVDEKKNKELRLAYKGEKRAQENFAKAIQLFDNLGKEEPEHLLEKLGSFAGYDTSDPYTWCCF